MVIVAGLQASLADEDERGLINLKASNAMQPRDRSI